MRTFITGANGFVGAHVARALIQGAHQVRGLVRQQSDLRSLTDVDIETIVGDVFDQDSMRSGMESCDVVFHTAAHFAYGGDRIKELETLALTGTRNVLTVAKDAGVRRVVLTSSSVVCGSSTRPMERNEPHSLEPEETAPYVLSKVKQEQLAFELADQLGLELVSACPTLVIGPRDYRLGPSNGMIIAYLNDPLRTSFPGGGNMVSVEDIAGAHVLLAEQGVPGERYLLGSENVHWQQIHEWISKLCGLNNPLWSASHTASYLAGAASELLSKLSGRDPLSTRAQAAMVGRYYWYDHSKAKALGYKPKCTYDALAHAIAWLTASEHVSRKLRVGLRLSRDTFSAMDSN